MVLKAITVKRIQDDVRGRVKLSLPRKISRVDRGWFNGLLVVVMFSVCLISG